MELSVGDVGVRRSVYALYIFKFSIELIVDTLSPCVDGWSGEGGAEGWCPGGEEQTRTKHHTSWVPRPQGWVGPKTSLLSYGTTGHHPPRNSLPST